MPSRVIQARYRKLRRNAASHPELQQSPQRLAHLNANPPYELVKSIPERFVGYGSSIDARWDATAPEILYFQYKKKFWKYNYVTDENVALYDFSADYPPAGGSSYPSCSQTLQEEGNSSSDSRYWAFNIRCYDPAHSPTWYNVAKVVFDKDFSGKDRGRIISAITPENLSGECGIRVHEACRAIMCGPAISTGSMQGFYHPQGPCLRQSCRPRHRLLWQGGRGLRGGILCNPLYKSGHMAQDGGYRDWRDHAAGPSGNGGLPCFRQQ